MNNRSAPVATVLPHICYRDVAQASDWLTRVFGFTEHYRYGKPDGVQMYLGGTVIMLNGPREGRDIPATLGCGTQMLTVFVPDVDAHYRHSQREGAKILEELNETMYGERQYGVADLDGHRWLFSQHARDVSPEEWGATVATPPTQPQPARPR